MGHMELLQDAGNQAAEHKKNWHAFLDKHVNKKLHSSKMAKNKKTKVSFWYKKYLKRDMKKTKQNQGNKLKALANKKQVAAVATKAKGHSFTKKTKSKKLSKSAFEKSQKAPLEKKKKCEKEKKVKTAAEQKLKNMKTGKAEREKSKEVKAKEQINKERNSKEK